MKIPKTLKKNNKKYRFIKEYENYVLYEEMWTGIKECFNKHELGLIQAKEKPRNSNPQRVKYL